MIRPDMQRAVDRVPTPPVTRFAPSPTGYLHLGHVVNAIYVWGLAQALGGSVILRIEDHDRLRSRATYDEALLEDLGWLGFLHQPITLPERHRQSARADLHLQALARLRATAHVYACDCSRRQIGAAPYPGRCRDRRVPERPGTGLRVRVEPGAEPFEDLVLGPLAQEPATQCGDLLIRDRDGHWTYQFAVTVDDMGQGVTLIIRGADLLSSTGRQLRLARMLEEASAARARHASPLGPESARLRGPVAGWRPVYLHHPLIYGADGRKLSKSTGSAGVRELRRAGVSPEEVIGRAAAAAGLLATPTPLDPGRLHALFPGGQRPRVQADPAVAPACAARRSP